MNYLDTADVPVAARGKSKFDLSTQHITTSDFMNLDCAYIQEVIPGESIDVKMETFSRMNAMPVPTFGRAVIKKHKFFVPFRQINPSFTDFVSDSVHINADYNPEANNIPQGIPTIKNSTLVNLFIGDASPAAPGSSAYTDSAMVYPVNPGESTFDINVTTASTGGVASVDLYSFTSTGRQVYKMLNQLGYDIVWTTLSSGATGFDKEYSLLPVLAWLKVYADYFFPSQYSNVFIYQVMQMLCKVDNGTILNMDVLTLRNCLKQVSYVQYDSNNPFIAAWDLPNQPTYGNYSNFKISNIDSVTNILGAGTSYNAAFGYDGNGYVTNNAGNSTSDNRLAGVNAPFIVPQLKVNNLGGVGSQMAGTPISEYLLKSLKALTAFMKRNQLVGSKSYERILSRYGVATPGEKLNRAVYLGSETQAVQIGDVMSTSDTDGAHLADFAGKGISVGTTHLKYDADEFGYVLILTSIVPMSRSYQGVDPLVCRINRSDFFVPEYDSLGSAPVGSISLYTPKVYNDRWSGLGEQVFGFLPRYWDYKTIAHDKLSGNFRVASLNGTNSLFPNAVNGASSWHLMREFDYLDYQAASGVVHSVDFMYGKNDNWQYKRIFYGGAYSEKGGITPDNFTIIHNFEVGAEMPAKKLFDCIDELEVDGEHIHKKMTLQAGGVKVN